MDGENAVVQEIVTPEQLDVVLQAHKENSQPKLGASLLQENIITQRQLNAALQKQLQDRNVPIGQILIGMGAVTEEIIRKVLSKRFGIPGLKLRKFQVDSEIIKLVPLSLATKLRAVPLYKTGHQMIVAMEDPVSREALQDLEMCVQFKIDPILASPEDINFFIRRYYGVSPVSSENQFIKKSEIETSAQKIEGLGKSGEHNVYVSQLIEKIIADAINQDANEIHIELTSQTMPATVRFRRHGKMVSHLDIQADIQKMLIIRLKTMAALNVQQTQYAQSGKLKTEGPSIKECELHAAFIPTHEGLEDVVIRILNKPQVMELETLDMPFLVLEEAKQVLKATQGWLLVCGPKLGGKTTTVHTLLHRINSPERKVWTIEKQIQINQAGLRQIQINNESGWTASNAINSVLNAGPDVIMVDEIQDASTAKVVLEASFGGPLVISSILANNAIEGINRFLDFGLDAFHFSNTMLGVLGQWLIPRLCTQCSKPHPLTPDEIEALAVDYCRGSSLDYRDVINSWQNELSNENGALTRQLSTGCDHCGNTGYKGLIGIYEWIGPSTEFKQKLRSNSQSHALSEMIPISGMRTMKHDGIEKVLKGLIDLKQLHAALFKAE